MSIQPMYLNHDLYNRLSTQKTQAERGQLKVLGQISGIDEVMRTRLDVVSAIAEVQLKVIGEILSAHEDKRDPNSARVRYFASLQHVKEEQLESLKNLMAAREAVIEEGRYVELTEEKKAEIHASFSRSIDQLIREAEQSLRLDSDDLPALKRQLEWDLQNRLSTYDTLMGSKSRMTEEFLALREVCRKIGLIRRQMLNPPSTDLFAACQNGDLEAVKKFSNAYWFDFRWVNQVDANGFSLLEIAAFNGQLEVVMHLLKSGANPNFVDPLGYQAIHWAAKAGYADIMKKLLAIRADSLKTVSLNVRGAYGRTPLHMAVFNHKPDCVALLIEKGADLNARTDVEDQGKTALHDAVMHLDLPMVRLLCEQQSLDVNVKAGGFTPLRIAVEEGCVEIAALILGHRSWRAEGKPDDPNHLAKLLETKCKYNQAEMRTLLRRFT